MTFSLYSYLGCRFHSILTWQMKILTEANYLTQSHMATNIWGRIWTKSLARVSFISRLFALTGHTLVYYISFLYPYVYVQKYTCVHAVVSVSAIPWTVAHQAPLSMGIFSQEYWGRLPFPPPEDLPDPGIKPVSHASPHWQADSLPPSYLESPMYMYAHI